MPDGGPLGGGVQVEDSGGGAVRVEHKDTPHLVSLGGGRLSTAVTLHPLPPEGKRTLGSGANADVVLVGTGVEAVHCCIENRSGVVTLHPIAGATAIDGLPVTQSTRLMQGCMICLGRSTCLRFNHPAEASLMKSALPNSRISVLPVPFFPGDENTMFGGVEGKPPPAPRRTGASSRDSWGDLSSASSEDLAKYISPKVFPAGSSTVNSPASVVLGQRAGPNSKLSNHVNGGELRFSLAPTQYEPNKPNGNVYQNVVQMPNGKYTPAKSNVSSSPSNSISERGVSPAPSTPTPPLRTHSSSSHSSFNFVTSPERCSPLRPLATPSPAFDRNPSYSVRKSVASPVPSWDSSIEDLTSRKVDLENKRKQAQTERLSEQETEKLEQLRLEEILTMCADYEKQAQWEKQNKPHQNRIKTNGSLTKDKRLNSPSSPHFNKNFSFESLDSSSLTSDNESKHRDQNGGQSLTIPPPPVHSYENVTLSLSHPGSPRTRIKTILPNKENNRCEYSLELIENRLAMLGEFTRPDNHTHKFPNGDSEREMKVPTNDIRENGFHKSANGDEPPEITSNGHQSPQEMNDFDGSNKPKSRTEKLAESKYQFLGFDPRKDDELPKSNKLATRRNFSSSASSLVTSSSDCPPVQKLITDSVRIVDTQSKSDGSNRVKSLDSRPSWTNPTLDIGIYSTLPRRNGEYTAEQLLSQLDAIVKSTEKSPVVLERGKFILPLPESEKKSECRNDLLASLTQLKAKITDIEQQQEELMREAEIEQALLGGEWRAQNEKLSADEKKLAALREKVQNCDKEMEICAAKQAERQAHSRKVLEQQQAILNTLELQLQNNKDEELRPDLLESLRQQQELLDAEKKSFEDLEFSLLEEEACWLSRREEVGREASEAAARCGERRGRLQALEGQRQAAETQAAASAHQLQLQRLQLLRHIEEARSRLMLLDQHRDSKKQSQDDLDRISRVTSGAPMEVSTNSLGRRTIASLQEIERNRQLHLAKQGSLVIEEERKRVLELKRRVQDEARAEWEERRQREHNCHSLNSVGSDESSLTSSDLHTESASSEDVEKRLQSPLNGNKTDVTLGNNVSKRDNEEVEQESGESRPISDASSYSMDQLTVRMRNKSYSNSQRPLTRYLPIKGESLDLRAHILSAGHQVELCGHVLLDQTSCRGFLHKMTSRFHQWNKRWFVFDRSSRTLTYYGDRSEKKPKGGVYFQAIEEVYVDHLNSVKSPNPQVTFVIKSSERTFHLVAPSPEAMRIWVDVIFTGAEGYQEFGQGS
ncbi:pleckstrin homology-like domain family B member 1 isoform X3 [Nilaparvata lugens]|nr:pleckstrin homology-like domain family B member 1 isoform X3 [Nilaparvata lugens]XP_039281255.1 pleckstrin homology-like domain family B member 1 isoform X3 [Nilaparvata lugens]